MAPLRITAREWLASRGFAEVAQMINDIEAEWRRAGKKTRRNWYEALAGGQNGEPRTIAGRTFPIIAEIRDRQKLEPSELAIKAGRGKRVPRPAPQNRWGGVLRDP